MKDFTKHKWRNEHNWRNASDAIMTLYENYRVQFGIRDSIRFVARELSIKPIDVAEELDLTEFFIKGRS